MQPGKGTTMRADELLAHMGALPMVKVVLPTPTGSIFLEGTVGRVDQADFALELFPHQLTLAELAPGVEAVLSCDRSGQVFLLHALVVEALGEKYLRLQPVKVEERPQQREFFRIDAEVFLKIWLVDRKSSGQQEVRRRQINLSGNGLRFEVDQPLRIGQLLGLELRLPEVDGEVAQGVGRVVRLVDQGEDAQQVSLELVEIEETEQDKIIRFCLAEQRKQLRMRVKVR